jgi:hypothetical protein
MVRGGREGKSVEKIAIPTSFRESVVWIRTGRATWLVLLRTYSCATAPDLHRLRL